MYIDPDYILVIGMVIGLLAIPALIGAFSESRTPRAAAIMVLLSAGLVSVAVLQRPNTYTVKNAPEVFMKVVGEVVN